MPIRVVVIEDHYLMMKAVLDELASEPRLIRVVGTATHGSELPRLVREHAPDVAILDLGMSAGNFEPITAVRSILQEYPDLRILVLTGYDDEIYIRQIVDAGALGYVLKNDDLSLTLTRGVRKVYEGKRFYSEDVIDKLFDSQNGTAVSLSEQELVVLRLAAQGMTNERIGRDMKVSEKRVRNLLSSVYAKLGLHDNSEINVRVAAINKGRELGLLPND